MFKKKYAVFTMDVEAFTDTECVAYSKEVVDIDLLDGFDEYIKILDKHGIKSTLFTVGSLAPKMAKRLKSCIENGHELALHNYEHIAPAEIDHESFRNNLLKSKNELSEMFGTEISGFRAPYFSMDESHLEIIKETGFKYDSSFLDFSAARHTVNLNLDNYEEISKNIYHNENFFEFGMQKHKLFGFPYPISGGGYIRLGYWPYIKSLIKEYLQKNNYYVFYLHPFELTNQSVPILKDLKPYDKFYLSYGIKTYANHIEQIINILKKLGYTFITFDELATKLKQKEV